MPLGRGLGKSGVYLGFWTPLLRWFLKHIITVRRNEIISVQIISGAELQATTGVCRTRAFCDSPHGGPQWWSSSASERKISMGWSGWMDTNSKTRKEKLKTSLIGWGMFFSLRTILNAHSWGPLCSCKMIVQKKCYSVYNIMLWKI